MINNQYTERFIENYLAYKIRKAEKPIESVEQFRIRGVPVRVVLTEKTISFDKWMEETWKTLNLPE